MLRFVHLLCLSVGLLGSQWLTATPSGAEILRFREVEKGRVFRGSQPEDTSDFLLLQKHKIRTIINLRTSEDWIEWEDAMSKHFGMQMMSRPIHPWFGLKPFEIDEIQNLLKDPTLQPVFIHCKHGKDRTGLMMGIYRIESQGWTREAAYDEMRSLGFNPWWLGLSRSFWTRSPQSLSWTPLEN